MFDRSKAPLASTSYAYNDVGRWGEHVERQIEASIQSDETIKLSQLKITFHFILHPAGGRTNATQNRDKESILDKKSVVRIVNDDNNCFWYALSISMNKKSRGLRDERNKKLKERVARDLCTKCKLPWDTPVSFLDLPLVEQTFNCNIYVIDLNNVPILGAKIDIWNTIMYKAPNKNKDHHWLLFDNDHYHLITNISGFLAVNHFCNKCFQCFERKTTYEKHECCSECEKPKRKINRNDHRTDKDLPHFLKSKFCNGSKEELNDKLQDKEDESKIEEITYNHNHPRYISFDYETDTHTLTHVPNHVEVDVLQIDENLTHEYDKCLIQSVSFPGYGCEDAFCDWLFTKENQNSTVIAHNGSGYDFKFILKWCISKGMTPDSYVRQGSRITYMRFNKFHLRFVDSYNFFLEKLSKLSKTYDIDTIKGHFPHHFNTPENHDYVGCIPCEDMFGVKNMDPDEYVKIEYERGVAI